ncbi:MAG: hypothetical protein V3T17_19500 [Pseudomonadales bacterium]
MKRLNEKRDTMEWRLLKTEQLRSFKPAVRNARPTIDHYRLKPHAL